MYYGQNFCLTLYGNLIQLIKARFILSDDTEFTSTGQGAKTGINYMADFEMYKKVIIEGHKLRPTWYENLMKKWNTELFGAQKYATYDEDEQGEEEFEGYNQFEDIMGELGEENDDEEGDQQPRSRRAKQTNYSDSDSSDDSTGRGQRLIDEWDPTSSPTREHLALEIISEPDAGERVPVASLNIAGLSITNEVLLPVPTLQQVNPLIEPEPNDDVQETQPKPKSRPKPKAKTRKGKEPAAIVELDGVEEPHGGEEVATEEKQRPATRKPPARKGKSRA